MITKTVAAEVSRTEDPTDRFVDAMLAALRLVRASPTLSAWFRPGEHSGGSLGLHSEAVNAIASAFIGANLGTNDDDTHRKAKWCVRVIVSLLAYPEDSTTEERTLITEFVAPLIDSDAASPLNSDANPTPAVPARSGGSARPLEH